MKQDIKKLMLFLLIINLIAIEGCGKRSIKVDKEIPMGRYIEEDRTGDIKASRVLGFFRTKEGTLQMYLTEEDKGLQIYEQNQEGNWTSRQREWVNLLNESRQVVERITRDQKGNIYVLYHEVNAETMEFSTFLGKVENGKLKKIEMAWQGERKFRAPHSLCILDNGDMLIAENKKPIERYRSSDGSFVKNYEGIPTRFVVSHNKLYQINPEKSVIEVYDADTDKLERSIPSENLDTSTLIEEGEEGDIYLIGSFGIKHLMKEGSMWELIVDGSLTCLSMPSHTCEYVEIKDKEIYAAFKKKEGYIAIKKYTYAKDIPATPSKELIAYTLRESSSLRQILTQYQLSHPDVKITLQVGLDKNSTLTQEDAIKALNTELLAGKGPDLILLDGLNINNYIEKGLLVDMDSWIKSDEEAQKCLENVMEAYRIKDKIYAIPVRFTLPTLWGDKKVIDKVKGIEDLAEYQKEHPEENVLPYKTPEELINLFYTTSSPLWFDNKGKLQEKEMIRFLESIKTLANKGTLLEDKKTQTMEEIRKPGINSADEEDVVDMAYHYADAFLIRAGQMLDILIAEEANRTRGDSDFTVFQCQEGMVFEPKTILGINAGSKKQEMAKEIIKLALSEEVQKVDVEEGLPVNEVALQYCMEGKSLPPNNSWGILGKREGKECWIFIAWAQGDPKVFEKYYDYCKKVKMPVGVDEKILEIVVMESKGYFEEAITAQEAAEGIKKKVEFYFAEG